VSAIGMLPLVLVPDWDHGLSGRIDLLKSLPVPRDYYASILSGGGIDFPDARYTYILWRRFDNGGWSNLLSDVVDTIHALQSAGIRCEVIRWPAVYGRRSHDYDRRIVCKERR